MQKEAKEFLESQGPKGRGYSDVEEVKENIAAGILERHDRNWRQSKKKAAKHLLRSPRLYARRECKRSPLRVRQIRLV